MPPFPWPLAAVSLLAIGTAAGAAPDPLSGLHWRKRVLLVAAPSAADAGLLAQRALLEQMRRGADERDLALVEAVGRTPEADALRRRFGLDPSRFRVLLIGKDGGAKLSSTTPLGPDRLFPVIDAMPMRQEEMTRRP